MSPEESEQAPMIPAIEPVRRMTETERLLMNELMYAQAAALNAQQEALTLKGAYQQQSQELTAAREQSRKLEDDRAHLREELNRRLREYDNLLARIATLEASQCPPDCDGNHGDSRVNIVRTGSEHWLQHDIPPIPDGITNVIGAPVHEAAG